MNHRLIRLRTEAGKTQAEVAGAIGVTQQAYQMYEAEERMPSIRTAGKISRYFNTTVDDIFLPQKTTKC
ncbi:helix-turn-helix transcriptional regulator [Peptococcus simiae]|uniref:helix-turn-helix transcriptional regulator n=1 Tax=Peptococcus simiae TaxID=1643805 RepID=UPI0039800F30